MTPLPPALPSTLAHLTTTVTDAYSTIQQLEKSAALHEIQYPQLVIHARVLGYLILEGPSDQAREVVANEIVSCENQEKVAELGKFYFKRYKGTIPFLHPYRLRGRSMDEMMEPSEAHQAANDQALVRDGFACVVTRVVDLTVAENTGEVRRMAHADGRDVVRTHCAHILPEYINKNISGNKEGDDKHQYVTSVLAVLERFGYKSLPSELDGEKIHCLQNIMTLDPRIHDFFDTLRLWFEPIPVGTANTYNVRWRNNWRGIRSAMTTVTFASQEGLPPPSPDYLRIHASCAKVANLSGAGDYIDKILSDLENIQVLSRDGVSAELLEHALLPLSQDTQVS